MKQYVLLGAGDRKELGDAVNSNLENGWELYGDPFGVAESESSHRTYCQAMVRENP